MSAITNHDWFTVDKLADDLWSIDDIGFDISYLVTGTERALLIDTGLGIGNIRAIAKELTSLPLTVVNTHAHPDHAGGDDQFPDVYLHRDDFRLAHVIFTRAIREGVHTRGKIFMSKKKITIDDIPDFNLDRWLDAKPNALHPLSHGDHFDLGDRTIDVFSIPGHTPGSILLLDRERGRIFGGDSLIERHPVWLHLDESAPLHVFHLALKSLCDISNLFNTVYSSHMKEGIDPSIIVELFTAVDSVLSGLEKGRHFRTFTGEGLIHRHNRAAIIYREDKL
ncbi:MAG TPA: MBL fold metallo-hydrolase [Spirochaetota bacterium]